MSNFGVEMLDGLLQATYLSVVIGTIVLVACLDVD